MIQEGFFMYLDDTGTFQGGFTLFGGLHLATLAALALLTAPMCVYYLRIDGNRRRVMLRAAAVGIFALEAVKQATFPLLHKHYSVYELPLHFCSVSIVIGLIYAFYPGKASGELLYSMSMPGALAALLYPNWSSYPLINFYSLQSFIIHALQVAFVLMPLLSGELRPGAKNLWRVCVFLAVVVPPIYLLNIRLDTNFFFVNAGSYGSPLQIFIERFGNPVFLIPYAGLVAAVWFFMYLPWELARQQQRQRDATPNSRA